MALIQNASCRMALVRFIPKVSFFALISFSAEAVTFEETLFLAYQNSAQLRAARAQLVAQQELIPQARSAFFPQLAARANFGFSNTRSTGQNLDLPDLPPETFRQRLNDNLIEANGSFNLFAGGQNLANLRIARAEVDTEAGVLLATIQMVLVQAALSYSDIYYFGQQVDVLQQQIQQLETLTEQLQFMLGRQNTTTSDVAQVQSQLADTQAQYQATLGQQQVAISQLGAIIGPFDGLVDEAPPFFILPETLSTAITEAQRDNPQLLQAIAQLKSATNNIALQQGARFPSLDLTLLARRELDRTRQSRDLVDHRRRDDYRAALDVNVPLFTGGLLRSQVRQAQAQRTSAAFTLEDTLAQVIAAIESSWASLNSAQLQIQANEQAVSAAETALDGLTRQFRDGTLSTQDLLNAQQLRYQTQFNEYTSQMAFFEATVNLLSTMGALAPVIV